MGATGGAVRAPGAVVAGGLAAIGVLHAVWARTPWPLSSPAEFADTVVGVDVDRLPTPAMCAEVAVALGAASYLVGARAGVLPEVGPRWLRTVGSGVVAGVLLGRGAGGLVLFDGEGAGGTEGTGEAEGAGGSEGARGAERAGWRIVRTERFVRLDRRYYSPLCLALGAGAAWVAAKGS